MADFSGLVVLKCPAASASERGVDEHEPQPEWSVEDLRARERAERAAAKQAVSLAARHAHQQLAQHYADLLRRAR